MKNVIGIGDNVCDVYHHLGLMFPGGQAFNFAVYCRMAGWNAAYIGAFGSDPVAKHVIGTARDLNIDISHARYYNGPGGKAEVDLQNGERVFLRSNKGGVAKEHPLRFTNSELGYIESFSLIHTSDNSYIDQSLSALGALSNLLSYDFSQSWQEEGRLEAICPHLDFAFLSCPGLGEDELEELLRHIHHLGCGTAVATMGEHGAVAFDGKALHRHTPKTLKPVDTLGAGDSMAAGFLMQWLRLARKGASNAAETLHACLEAGAQLAAKTCMTQGAFGYGTKIS